MISFRFSFVTFAVLVAVTTPSYLLIAQDEDCGDAPKTVSTEKLIDTKLALTGLPKITKLDAEIGVKYNNKITSLITQFPNADQVVLRQGAWVVICKTIRKSNMSPVEKVRAYLDAEHELLPEKAPQLKNAPPAQRSRNAISTKSAKTQEHRISVQTPTGDIDLEPIDVKEGAAGWALRYLPSSPPQGLANPYFVIVQSVQSEQEGQNAINKLRSRFPEYDFALYEPYEGNKSWGIMMAAWVSRADASKVLNIAKSKVNPQAYLWHF